MSNLYGSDIKDPNFIFRFTLIVFCGIITFGVVLFWRGSLLFASEYQDMPVTHQQIKIRKENVIKKKILQDQLINLQD